MLKKIFLFLFASIAFCATAQTASFADVRTLIQSQADGIDLNNRLVALQVWSVNSPESREQNKAFDKTFTTFEWAKLKGGKHGIVCITVCIDPSSSATIAFTKDGITKLKTISKQDVAYLTSLQSLNASYNVVFDANGQKVYESLPSGKIYSSIQQLITR
jgi:hypothetical protein